MLHFLRSSPTFLGAISRTCGNTTSRRGLGIVLTCRHRSERNEKVVRDELKGDDRQLYEREGTHHTNYLKKVGNWAAMSLTCDSVRVRVCVTPCVCVIACV